MKIREQVKRGKSRYELAREFGVDPTTIYKYTRDLPKQKQKRLTSFEKQRIREEVKRGKSRYKLAREFGVDPKTIYFWTEDLPKCDRGKKSVITEGMKRKIRKMVKSGMPRHDIAKIFGVSASPIYRFTKDLPDNRGKSIRGQTLMVLVEIMKNGYIIPKTYMEVLITKRAYRLLRNYIPIKKADLGNKKESVYFIEGKGKEAFRAFLKATKKKVMGYQQLCAIMPLFGIPKKDYQEAVFGKSSIKEKVIKGLNAKKRALSDAVSDNFGRFLHSELLYWVLLSL